MCSPATDQLLQCILGGLPCLKMAEGNWPTLYIPSTGGLGQFYGLTQLTLSPLVSATLRRQEQAPSVT